MPTNNDFDTSFAKTISQIMSTELSTYAASLESLLGKIDVIPFGYGKQHITRPISDPYQDVMVDRRFAAPEQEGRKLVQELDFVCISKRLRIDRVDWAADPKNAANHVRDYLSIVKDGIEKYFIEGSSTRILMYGLSDYPSGTTGTINRPEMAYDSSTAGDWNTTSNIRTDLINCETGLILKKFRGRKAILAPTIVKPMLSELISAGTPVSSAQWVNSIFGMPIIYSPFVHEAATKDDFNLYMVDLDKIHFGMSDLKVDSFYDNKDHAFFVDFEIYLGFLADPLWDGTEYLKGIARLDARDWAD